MATAFIPDSSPLESHANDESREIVFAKRGCCFWMPCLRSGSSPTSVWWEWMRSPVSKDDWWNRGLRRIREWSEIVVGPKWKTFIRRFSKSRPITHTKQGSFQYDPLSYALNFDDGMGQKSEDDYGYLDFSTRYASILASAKSSMDLGKDGPTFT